jgi:hypothetical protein
MRYEIWDLEYCLKTFLWLVLLLQSLQFHSFCDRGSGLPKLICDNLIKRSTDIIRRLKDIQQSESSGIWRFTLCKHQRVYLFHRYLEFVVFSRFQWSGCFSCLTHPHRLSLSWQHIAFFPDLSIWTAMFQKCN